MVFYPNLAMIDQEPRVILFFKGGGGQFCNTFPMPDVLEIRHLGVPINCMFIGDFKVK